MEDRSPDVFALLGIEGFIPYVDNDGVKGWASDLYYLQYEVA